MENKDIKYAQQVYKKFAEIPTISHGKIILIQNSKQQQVLKLSINKTQKDVVNNKKSNFFTEHYVNMKDINNTDTPTVVIQSSTPIPVSSETLLHLPSPSGKYTLRLLKEKKKEEKSNDPSSSSNFIFEIYNKFKRLHRIEAGDIHGQVYLGHPFGTVVWSTCETRIGYVAEKKPSKKLKLFSKENDDKSIDDDDVKMETMNGEFEYDDDFGEQMNGARSPMPFFIDLEAPSHEEVKINTVQIHNDEFSKLAFGQFQFTPNNKNKFVAVGWNTTPRRFGIIYYNTRPSKLYLFNTNDDDDASVKTKCITPNEDDYSVCNPRFSPDGKSLIYLTTKKTAVHNSCSALKLMQWNQILNGGENTVPNTTIIDFVEEPKGKEGFCGLFDCGTWPKQPFLNNEIIVFSSLQRSVLKIYYVHLYTKVLTLMPMPDDLRANDEEGYSARVLSACEDIVLWKFNRVNLPDKAYVSRFSSNNAIFHHLGFLEEEEEEMMVQSLPMNKIFSMEKEGSVLQGILTLPKSSTNSLPPLILSPHGGPHSATIASFNPTICMFNQLGFAVLQVNYRGSLGFGLKALESLPGKVGRQDVDDCMSILKEALRRGECNEKEIFVLGGSHGGFLTGHLIAQFPNQFRAAAARNPVLNMAGEFVATDIPDWCHVEAGTGVDVINDGNPYVPTENIYAKLYAKSPISLVGNIKTPLMLMVGGADIRVPWAQSYDFYHILKSKGVPVKLLAYPNMQHALSDFAREEADVWINVVLWFCKFISARDELDLNFCKS